MNLSARTAISRKKLSTPMSFLFCSGLLNRPKRVLDYGCGRGDDIRHLQSMVTIQGYDPNHRPEMPEGLFDVITCNFVLNVIEDPLERGLVQCDIMSRLAPGGTAYISVRNDKHKLRGTTKLGTWQGYIKLPEEVIKVTPEFVMYRITNTL